MRIDFSREELLIILFSMVTFLFAFSQTYAEINSADNPFIIVKGETIMTINVGEKYVDEGVIAYDFQQGFITQYVTTQGNVDVNIPGVYTIFYNVRDAEWNYAETKKRTVIVVKAIPSILKPEILSHSIGDFEGGTVDISFKVDQQTQAVVGYGLNGEYSMFSVPERSFTFDFHMQPLPNITKGEIYSYIIYVRNESGLSNYVKGTFEIEVIPDNGGVLGFTNIKDGDIISLNQELIFTKGDEEIMQWIIGVGTESNSKLYDVSPRLSGMTDSYTIKNLPNSGPVVVRLWYKNTRGEWGEKKYGFSISSDNIQIEYASVDNVTEDVSTHTASNGWNDTLPNGGRAIGVVTYGQTTGNTTLVSHKYTRRFLATRSGEVKSFMHFNRILLERDIETRAIKKRETEPVWYEMQQAVGNDPKRGGYMLANSYSVGNGGLQEVTIQTDSGAPDHLPTGNIVAKAETFVPFDLNAGQMVEIPFETRGTLAAGEIYHLVYENLSPPNTALRNMSGEQAKNAPIDKGAIALDGVSDGQPIDPENRGGPFMRNFAATMYKQSPNDTWHMTKIKAMFSLIYSDGIEVGEMYAHIHGQGSFKYYVEGDRALRQQFIWEYPNIRVDRLVTRRGYEWDTNGKTMNTVIKDQSGRVLATGTIPFDQELKDAANSGNWFTENQTRHWVTHLSNIVELEKGQTYYIEYKAPAGAGVIMSPALDSNMRYGSNDWLMQWGGGQSEARATQSTDAGKSWVPLNSFQSSDLPIYLIPIGIPTETPVP